MISRITAFFLLLLSIPVWPILYFAVKITSKGPFIFKQTRMGKNKRTFTMYKIRTMIIGAENLQTKYAHLNEADGPVFKIRNDPRFTKFGKFLAHTALDELPQLINIIKGDMALVGPRPLPVYEAKKIHEKFQGRFKVLPGITSSWILKGAHKLSFEQWMREDLEYIKSKSLLYDATILLNTFFLIAKLTLTKFRNDKNKD